MVGVAEGTEVKLGAGEEAVDEGGPVLRDPAKSYSCSLK
jgi:hypothetical protein